MFLTPYINRFFAGRPPHPPRDPETSAGPKTVVVPRIPQDIIEEILDHLASDSNSTFFLRSCSCVSKLWVQPSRRHLFHTIYFNLQDMSRWLRVFPVREQSPAHHVRELHLILLGHRDYAPPREFFGRIRGFANLKKIVVVENETHQTSWIPWLVGLPKSPTSLTISADSITVPEIRDIMVQLPNLNNLSLWGPLRATDRSELQGIGSALRGKFGGHLHIGRLNRSSDDSDLMNMLLEVPTGLHFTQIHVYCWGDCLSSITRLAEACSNSLVKLIYSVKNQVSRGDLGRPLDFAKLPNIEHVTFEVEWIYGDLHWIPPALSTVKPTTSPRLSVIELEIGYRCRREGHMPQGETPDDDIRLIKEEAIRIKHEYMGAVKVTIHQCSVGS